MVFEKATYLHRLDAQHVIVETQIKNSCQACQHNSDCGTGLIAKTLAPKTNLVTALCELDLKPQQTVILQVSEQTILFGSLLMYGLPILSMLVVAMIAQFIFNLDLVTALAAMSGLGLGLYWVKKMSQTMVKLPQVVELTEASTFTCVE